MARCTTPEYSPDLKRKSSEDLCAAKKLKHYHNDPRHNPIKNYNNNKRAVFISGLYPRETKHDVKQVVEQFGDVESLRAGNLSWKKYNNLVNEIGKDKISPHYKVVFRAAAGARSFMKNAPPRYVVTYDSKINDVQYDIYGDTVFQGMYKLFGMYKMDESLQTEIRKLDETEQVFNAALWIENLRSPWAVLKRNSPDYMKIPGVSIDSKFSPKQLKTTEVKGENNEIFYETIAEFASFVGFCTNRDPIKSISFAVEKMMSEIVKVETIQIIRHILKSDETGSAEKSVSSLGSPSSIDFNCKENTNTSEIEEQKDEILAITKKLTDENSKLKKFKKEHRCPDNCTDTQIKILKYENEKCNRKLLEERLKHGKTKAQHTTMKTDFENNLKILETKNSNLNREIGKQSELITHIGNDLTKCQKIVTKQKSDLTAQEIDFKNFFSRSDELEQKLRAEIATLKSDSTDNAPACEGKNAMKDEKLLEFEVYQKNLELEAELKKIKADKKTSYREQSKKYQDLLKLLEKKDHKISEHETNNERLEKKIFDLEEENILTKRKNLEAVKKARVEEKERYQEQAELSGRKLADPSETHEENSDIKKETDTQ